MKFKTQFVDRIIATDQHAILYDLDGTIIDSSQRIRFNQDGSLDLNHWRENSTKENIFQDRLLPLYTQLQNDYRNGHIIIIITARELGKWDLEYIHSMGIYYDYIISRPIGETMVDWKLKKKQSQWLWNLKPWQKIQKVFYDDNLNNLKAIKKNGYRTTVIDAGKWNNAFGY